MAELGKLQSIGEVLYSPKSNTRNHIPGPNCTKKMVSGIRFRPVLTQFRTDLARSHVLLCKSSVPSRTHLGYGPTEWEY
eukprot:2808783-Rhodomonas_salina.1